MRTLIMLGSFCTIAILTGPHGLAQDDTPDFPSDAAADKALVRVTVLLVKSNWHGVPTIDEPELYPLFEGIAAPSDVLRSTAGEMFPEDSAAVYDQAELHGLFAWLVKHNLVKVIQNIALVRAPDAESNGSPPGGPLQGSIFVNEADIPLRAIVKGPQPAETDMSFGYRWQVAAERVETGVDVTVERTGEQRHEAAGSDEQVARTLPLLPETKMQLPLSLDEAAVFHGSAGLAIEDRLIIRDTGWEPLVVVAADQGAPLPPTIRPKPALPRRTVSAIVPGTRDPRGVNIRLLFVRSNWSGLEDSEAVKDELISLFDGESLPSAYRSQPLRHATQLLFPEELVAIYSPVKIAGIIRWLAERNAIALSDAVPERSINRQAGPTISQLVVRDDRLPLDVPSTPDRPFVKPSSFWRWAFASELDVSDDAPPQLAVRATRAAIYADLVGVGERATLKERLMLTHQFLVDFPTDSIAVVHALNGESTWRQMRAQARTLGWDAILLFSSDDHELDLHGLLDPNSLSMVNEGSLSKPDDVRRLGLAQVAKPQPSASPAVPPQAEAPAAQPLRPQSDVEDQFKVFSLLHTDASSAAAIIKELFQDTPLVATVEIRTNRLAVRGPPSDLAVAETLLLHLDEADNDTRQKMDTPHNPEYLKQMREANGAARGEIDTVLRGLAAADKGTPAHDEGMTQLRAVVRAAFEIRQKLQQAEVAALRARIDDIESRIATRDKLRDAIIDQRVKQLAKRGPAATQPRAEGAPPQPTHGRYSLNYPGVPWREALENIAEMLQVELVIEAPMSGQLDYTTRFPVSLDVVLEALRQRLPKGLELTLEDGQLWVAREQIEVNFEKTSWKDVMERYMEVTGTKLRLHQLPSDTLTLKSEPMTAREFERAIERELGRRRYGLGDGDDDHEWGIVRYSSQADDAVVWIEMTQPETDPATNETVRRARYFNGVLVSEQGVVAAPVGAFLHRASDPGSITLTVFHQHDSYDATVLLTDDQSSLALLKIDAWVPFIELAPQEPATGQLVNSYVAQEDPTTKSVVSARVLHLSRAASSPGHLPLFEVSKRFDTTGAGAPLLDSQYRLLGIVAASYHTTETTNQVIEQSLGIPATRIRHLLQQYDQLQGRRPAP